MAWWNIGNVDCINCKGRMSHKHEEKGEHIFWCKNCGTLLTANEFDPISMSDWHIPKCWD
jgi:transcription initiation factor TFIIIB Brf1 subunit/transcription initiation factor TFIIB